MLNFKYLKIKIKICKQNFHIKNKAIFRNKNFKSIC